MDNCCIEACRPAELRENLVFAAALVFYPSVGAIMLKTMQGTNITKIQTYRT